MVKQIYIIVRLPFLIPISEIAKLEWPESSEMLDKKKRFKKRNLLFEKNIIVVIKWNQSPFKMCLKIRLNILRNLNYNFSQQNWIFQYKQLFPDKRKFHRDRENY